MQHFQIDVGSSATPVPSAGPPGAPAFETVELLRQLLEVQREQLAMYRAAAQAHDAGARWRAFMARWRDEFPGLAEGCRQALPALERCYSRLLAEMGEQLNPADGDTLDNDFALQEFLDRYGMRLAQLGAIMNLVGPLADAGPGDPS